jgi:aminoglycoside 3-N-acetyltransferase
MTSTRRTLGRDLAVLGVQPGDLLMAHAGVRSVGRIVGGVNTLVQALLDSIGTEGTLTAYVDFEPFYEDDDDSADIPVFDKQIAHAARDHGVLHETLRNWPASVRSDHPDAGVIAIGRLAHWVAAPHPFQYGYGAGSPFERVVQARGRVLMIGAPLDTITLLHYAEDKALLPGKRIRNYRRLMPGKNGPEWLEFEEFDTANPVAAYLPADCFEQIARAHLAAGFGVQGRIGEATSYLFDAPELVRFAIEWLEQYGKRQGGRG